jgi:Fe-S-cluster-containing dehydrogenase component
MKKWRMIIDLEKCEDCNNCFMACKDEYVDNEWPGYTSSQARQGQRWINIMRKERGQFPLIDVVYRPTPCMQCDKAPCIQASNGVITKRPDGIVLIDSQKAKGKKDLVRICPYGMISWNEEKDVPQKCTFCAHLLDQGWKQPRCVQACPTGALRIVKVDDVEMGQIVEMEQLESLHPEFGTSPSVYYKNLYRYSKHFIAGSLAFDLNGVVECLGGATVKLFKESIKLDETLTDIFGDFRFDKLTENSGNYIIEIFYNNKTLTFGVDLKTSLNLGTIQIS